MFCSGCGHALAQGQIVCPQCNRPVAPQVPPVPGFEFLLAGYASKVRVLGILWLVYAGITLIFGIVGLAFAHAFLSGFGPFAHSHVPQTWFFPGLLRFAWLFMVGRAVLAAVAGWGLLERTQWGRIVAIIAAILSLIRIPLGTALGIATLIILIGARNWTLYDEL
ncbi:MAG: hypothetical protein ABSF75_08345 [Terracidiphilus sp.]|jgi:hypothetical protein